MEFQLAHSLSCMVGGSHKNNFNHYIISRAVLPKGYVKVESPQIKQRDELRKHIDLNA